MYIYHERQESKLCGQHCLNNLLQCPVFTAPDLSEIALELDRREGEFMSEGGITPEMLSFFSQASSNVDESGNFSVEVLRSALKRSHGIELVSWAAREERACNPAEEKAFIVNRSEHWFTLRKIGASWWNLNSCLDLPEMIGEFYLSAFLGQLRNEGYSVFIARGPIPERGSPTDGENPYFFWHKESDLRSGLSSRSSSGGTSTESSASSFVAFSGVGRRLQDRKTEEGVIGSSRSSSMNSVDSYDEEAMIQAAIRASLTESSAPIGEVSYPPSSVPPTPLSSTPSGMSQKDIARAQRLAALEKRGMS